MNTVLECPVLSDWQQRAKQIRNYCNSNDSNTIKEYLAAGQTVIHKYSYDVAFYVLLTQYEILLDSMCDTLRCRHWRLECSRALTSILIKLRALAYDQKEIESVQRLSKKHHSLAEYFL